MRIGFALLFSLVSSALSSAPATVLIRTVDGAQVEGQASLRSIQVDRSGAASDLQLAQILSVRSGAPATDAEKERITSGLAAIQGKDRKARDLAVEELTAIGLPVATPLLQTLKDTDQHEPRPLYKLFERVMPSASDGFDRSLSLVRLSNGESLRVKLPDGTVQVRTADGKKVDLPWAKIRSLAVRQAAVRRVTPIHSLRHCTSIDYLDTGIVVTPGSKLTSSAQGFVRLSWDADGWASDANGLTKPGSSSYKTNLVDGHPFGALIGRVGANGETFLLGKNAQKSGLAPGRLLLAVNDNTHWQNNVGTYTLTLNVTDAYDLGDPQ